MPGTRRPKYRCTSWAPALAALLASGLALCAQAEPIFGGITRAVTALPGEYAGGVAANPFIVTSSAPPTGGDRLTIPGDVGNTFGVDTDGVARLSLDLSPNPGGTAICSATLLETGRHLLTAAHCVTNPDGTNALVDGDDGNTVSFELPGGPLTINFTSADVTRHPLYTGDLFAGFDLAVIDLGQVLPTSVPRYGLNTMLNIEGAPHLAVGYGQSGDGATGATITAGAKRSGLNAFRTTGLPVAPLSNLQTMLTADFDSGDTAQNGFEVFFGLTGGVESAAGLTGGLGFDDDEVGIAPGDSGGPSFVVDPNTNEVLIAGVHSYGLRLGGVTTSDIDGVLNSSFGEFYADARVADPDMLGFIHDVTGIPEPAAGLTLTALLASAGTRRRTPSEV